MPDSTAPARRTTAQRAPSRRGASSAVALAAVAIIAAACGGGTASPGIASLGSTTTTTAAPNASSPTPFAGIQQEYQYALSYASCMRSHGVPGFPDPVLTSHNLTFNSTAESSSPQYASANKACKHLLPDDGGAPTPAQLATETAKLLQYAKCMRAHGEPNFPDPTVSPNQFGFSLKGIDPQSTQFQAAQQACKALSPGGP